MHFEIEVTTQVKGLLDVTDLLMRRTVEKALYFCSLI